MHTCHCGSWLGTCTLHHELTVPDDTALYDMSNICGICDGFMDGVSLPMVDVWHRGEP